MDEFELKDQSKRKSTQVLSGGRSKQGLRGRFLNTSTVGKYNALYCYSRNTGTARTVNVMILPAKIESLLLIIEVRSSKQAIFLSLNNSVF